MGVQDNQPGGVPPAHLAGEPGAPVTAPASTRSLRVLSATIGGLLLIVIGALALTINENARVKRLTEQALNFDVEVEDEGDDVRIAVLELRHVHRNIALGGYDADSLSEFDAAYAALIEELGELGALNLQQHGLAQPDIIEELATAYLETFRPAITLVTHDRPAFDSASQRGLALLHRMDDAASVLDSFGEQLADESMDRVSTSLRTEQAILAGLMIGAVGIAVALVVTAGRVLRQWQTLTARDQETRAALADALGAKTAFIADASHELRTPLAIIMGAAQTALASPSPQGHTAALRDIEDEAGRMRHLVEDLLFLARSDAGAPPLDIELTPARWLANRIARSAAALAHQHGACLETATTGQGYLEVDPDRIQQAVLILIDNAVRHGGDAGCVVLSTHITQDRYIVSVRDQGPGISAEELPRIFERFYQVKSGRTRSQSGAGLGLSIAQSIVTAHGGHLSAASTPGDGATMTITLSLAAVDLDHDGDGNTAEPARAAS
ncbi:MAG: ATP-binding protein [Thermomicrobiales bacterium]